MQKLDEISFGKLFDDAAGISRSETIGWNVPAHNTTRPDHAVVADAHPSWDEAVRANPHVLTDSHWLGHHPIAVMDTVASREHLVVAAKGRSLADADGCVILKNRVSKEDPVSVKTIGVIHSESRAKVYLAAVGQGQGHIKITEEFKGKQPRKEDWRIALPALGGENPCTTSRDWSLLLPGG